MSSKISNCERSESKIGTDIRSEADGLDSFAHSLSIRVEYYRSLEYCLKWKSPMYPKRSSRPPKASKKSPERSPSPDEEVIHRKLRGKRQRTGLRRTKSNDADDRDIIDVINSTNETEHVAEEDKMTFVEVTDKGVDESDEDSVASSVASGPSLSYHARPSQDRCSACQKLYQKAVRMKAPIKNKLLDNDPKSLTCDQWVLIKKWRPRRLPSARGKLLIHVQLIERRLRSIKTVKRRHEYVEKSSACCRPHIFLQRNLRSCVKVPVKHERKMNKRRKRTRDDSRCSRVAKQQRLHSNTRHQHISSTENSSSPATAHSSVSGLEDSSNQEINNQTDADLTVELHSSSVTMETKSSRVLPLKKRISKTAQGFRDLLAQLRSNSSMIVRETR